MISYSSFLQFFSNICDNHPNVTEFTVNEIEDFDIHKQGLWPLVHLVTENMLLNEGKMTYTFTLIVADRVTDTAKLSSGQLNILSKKYKGVSNTVDVINSCQMTAGDIFSYIKRNAQAMDFTIENDVLITPFIEKGQNIVAGVSAQFIIDTSFDNSACLITLSPNEAMGATDDCCLPIPPSPSPTPSVTASPSATPSVTPSVTNTPSVTTTPSVTVTPSVTPSVTVTPTISVTPSVTVTPSISVTPSITPSITVTPSITPTPSFITGSFTNWIAGVDSACFNPNVFSGTPTSYTFVGDRLYIDLPPNTGMFSTFGWACPRYEAYLPDVNRFGDSAFAGSGLISASFPQVTSMQGAAGVFAYSPNLSYIDLSNVTLANFGTGNNFVGLPVSGYGIFNSMWSSSGLGGPAQDIRDNLINRGWTIQWS